MAYTTIDNPELYFQCKTYTGNGSSGHAITFDGEENMQPDFVWIKNRTQYGHQLYDVVRGVTKRIFSDTSGAEETDTDALTAFGSNGFTIGSNAGVNQNSTAHVSWNWKAGGSGSANNDGSINTTSTSANSTSGFSVSKFTATGSAATIGHGMSAIPKMIWVKRTDSSGSWQVYHASLGATKYLELHETQEVYTNSGRWNDTEPTSSVFSIAGEFGSSTVNIAYAFAEKTGYCKIGAYIGNGNADGTFVYTGFRSAMIIFKQSSASGEKWYIYDNKRNTFNITNSVLFPSSNDAESATTTGAPIDILSNGFKLRGTDAAGNADGSTYIFMAFAESPFVNSNGVPNNAR